MPATAGDGAALTPGQLDEQGTISCGSAGVRPLLVQPAGKRLMSYEEFRRGRRLAAGAFVRSIVPAPMPSPPAPLAPPAADAGAGASR